MRTLALLLLAGLAGATSALRAHPIHTSLAEADYNARTRKLEIALRVFADDFEQALSARAGRKISLDRTPAAELDALAFAYVQDRFTIRLPSAAPAAPAWVGRELRDATNELWLYLEAPLPGGVEGVRVRHALLAEIFPDQLNSVRVRAGSRQVTLLFPPGHAERTVTFPPLAAPYAIARAELRFE